MELDYMTSKYFNSVWKGTIEYTVVISLYLHPPMFMYNMTHVVVEISTIQH